MRINIIRVFRNLILRRRNRLTDPAHPEVQIRYSILKHARVRIRIQRELVLLDRLGRIILPS
jgi:hypothetical protein